MSGEESSDDDDDTPDPTATVAAKGVVSEKRAPGEGSIRKRGGAGHAPPDRAAAAAHGRRTPERASGSHHGTAELRASKGDGDTMQAKSASRGSGPHAGGAVDSSAGPAPTLGGVQAAARPGTSEAVPVPVGRKSGARSAAHRLSKSYTLRENQASLLKSYCRLRGRPFPCPILLLLFVVSCCWYLQPMPFLQPALFCVSAFPPVCPAAEATPGY